MFELGFKVYFEQQSLHLFTPMWRQWRSLAATMTNVGDSGGDGWRQRWRWRGR